MEGEAFYVVPLVFDPQYEPTAMLSPIPGWQGEGREFQGGICNSEDVGKVGAHLVKSCPSYR